MSVRRPLVLVAYGLALVSILVGCGFGLNTGNQTERSEWEEAYERRAQAARDREQREAIINQLQNGTLPENTTTIFDPDNAPLEDATDTSTTRPEDPVVGDAWCYDLLAFVELGETLFRTGSTAYLDQLDEELVRRLEAVALGSPPEIKPAAAALRDALVAFLAANPLPTDGAQMGPIMNRFATENADLLEEVIGKSTGPCIGEEYPIDVQPRAG